ncbi:cytochrome c550 [Thalassorhabdus alkalitolerans]|uniref:Cytochrome c550 n=1 Tax=Thalassorhabdus alkalitolerans TaxID=2282697 RepID=A0ABW0YS85_9BACI|nr:MULTISPECIES: cytochrome c [Bacillaceae]
MKRSPLIPFFITAVVGILLMLSLSLVGLDQQASIEDEENGENGEEETEIEDPIAHGEELVNSNCISCHGDNLEGGQGPAIDNLEGDFTVEEIADIAENGIGSMPGGWAEGEDAEAIGEYLLSISE